MTAKRGRPAKDAGEKKLRHSVLDEMENRSSMRVKDGNRVPLTARLKLEWTDIEDGYNYQWATDSDTYPVNLQQMCDAGYTFVRHKYGQIKGQPVIQNSRGCNLYLMRCLNEFFEADQEAKSAKSIAQHKEIMRVDNREYAGDSKELGKGKVATLDMTEIPDAIRLMEGD